jgi:Fe2+ transport system protein FeoA
MSVKVSELGQKGWGIVQRIDAEDDDMARLMALGVCEGRVIELVRSGNPLILRVFGTQVGVSRRLADRVLVKPCTKQGDV